MRLLRNEKLSVTSRGWIIVLGLFYSVLLTIGAISLGMALTIGRPSSVEQTIVTSEHIKTVTAAENRLLQNKIKQAGITVPAKTTLITETDIKQFVHTGMAASMASRNQVALAPTEAAIMKRVQASQAKPLTQQEERRVRQAVHTELQKQNDDYLKGGIGSAYPLLVLMSQTGSIVAGILAVIDLGLLTLATHGWWRWLRVTGRLTYIVGFFGGVLASLGGVESIIQRVISGTDARSLFLIDIAVNASATWKRVAGTVIVIGLVLSGSSYLLKPRKGREIK